MSIWRSIMLAVLESSPIQLESSLIERESYAIELESYLF